MAYDESYYKWNKQAKDRPALWFYTRLARKYFKQGRVLDFGSGTGFLLRRLRRYFQADGFEISAHAKACSEELLNGVRIFDNLADIPSASYTGIITLHVFEHITDEELQGIFVTFRRILQPGGRILCVVPELNGRGHIIKGKNWFGFNDPTHVNLKTLSEWNSFFQDNGFTVVRTGTDGLWHLPYSTLPRFLDVVRFSWLTMLQFVAGHLLMSASTGESAIFILEHPQ